jgi:PAS domain S-box-containing protein
VREPLISLDQDLRVVTVSRSFYEVFKVKPEETVGQLIYDLGNKQWDIPKLRELLETILPEKTTFDNYEVEHDFTTIGKRIMLLNARQIKRALGKERIILLAIEDITERKQLESLLIDSEERYRHLFETASDGIVFLEQREGKITHANQAIEKMLGYSLEESVGKKLQDIGIVDIDDLQTLMQILDKSGITNYTDVQIKTKSGQHIDADLYLADRAKLVQCNIRGITERKQAEEEKRILEERLQHADKMEAIGTLAGGIAHDFNNLLTGIQGYASLTLLNLDQDDPNRERLKQILNQVQSGAELTMQLLGFARGGKYEVKPANMNDIIEKSSSLFGRTKKEIAIHKKYENDLCPVEVDRGQMEQVFINLYLNAWQAMPGGGEIYLKTENVLLNDEQALSGSVKPGRYIKISVTDTGTGMDEKTKARIFDPFFTTKAKERGTGLGLSMVYGIIKGHKGMINVYSELDHGTTFTIYLPASDKEVVKEETVTGTIARGTETILLVDDEKMVLETNKEILEFLGYKVYAFGSGQEAIDLYLRKSKEIDLVILDMIMSGISGGKTFDRLREINPKVKVILSSGYSLSGEVQTIMERGCNGFLQKPFQLEEISQKVREILD